MGVFYFFFPEVDECVIEKGKVKKGLERLLFPVHKASTGWVQICKLLFSQDGVI